MLCSPREELKLPESNPHQVTLILQSLNAGDKEAAVNLLPMLYDELRRLARSMMAGAAPGNTLQATALVHEAYLRLMPQEDPHWDNRRHFFGAAAKSMRRILVEQARRKKTVKHGGMLERVDIEVGLLGNDESPFDFLDLDHALDELALLDQRKVDVVLLRYLTGLSIAETATALGISPSTVEADWRFARAFLFEMLADPEGISN